MTNVDDQNYMEQLQGEAAAWSANAQTYYQERLPDWRYLKRFDDYWIFQHDLEHFWQKLHPGDRVLELGCGGGWNALEMARRGANVTAIDIAPGALEIAKSYYEQARQRENFAGTIDYRLADINHLESFPGEYDWVVMVGALHHIPDPDAILKTCQRLLKTDGHLFVFDPLDTTWFHSIVTGFFFLFLPTKLSYRDKFRRLLAVRGQAVQRMGISIEQRGMSPFEGVGRTKSPRDTIQPYFQIESYHQGYSIRSFLAQELAVQPWLSRILLRLITPIEWLLETVGLLHGLRYFAIARPR